MMKASQIKAWINTFDDNADIAIDEGGLSLVEVHEGKPVEAVWIEVGGIPLEESAEPS